MPNLEQCRLFQSNSRLATLHVDFFSSRRRGARGGRARKASPAPRAGDPASMDATAPRVEHCSMPKPLARLSIDLRFSSTSKTASYTVKRVPDRRAFQIAEPSRSPRLPHQRVPDQRGSRSEGSRSEGFQIRGVPDQRGSISEGRQIRGFQTPFQMTLRISTSTQKTLATL